MNFNYSYRAFLITSLLCGSLVLILYSIRLRSLVISEEDITYDVELITPEIPEPELPNPDLISEEKRTIETNRAFNQNEKEEAKIARQSKQLTEATKGKLAEMEQALRDTDARESDYLSRKTPSKTTDKSAFSNAKNESSDLAINSGGNRHTNVFYNLPGREALQLPNPVYTCAASGTVVINIEVDTYGKVIKATANRTASSTTNQCLVDAAKTYSTHALFTSASAVKQNGTITFIFPGQE